MFRALPFYLSYLLPPSVVFCIVGRGWWTFGPLAALFILLPLADAALGPAGRWREAPGLGFNRWFRLVTWFWAPLQLLLMLFVMRTVNAGRLTPLELIGTTVSLGLTTGVVGITVAHELIHRRHALERAIGYVLLGAVSYSHFALSHVHWHHRWVGTPHDPSTARLGESLYHFLPRTVFGNLRAAGQIERDRLGGAWVMSPLNRMVRLLAAQVALYLMLYAWIGWLGVAVFAGQALVAILVVEAINYIEHYGLQRELTGSGTYERVAPYHTWDSTFRVSNWLLFNLPRHADHHCSVLKRYQSLELLPSAPRLPAGYGAMFLLALVPPAWFHVMNPRVAQATKSTQPI